MTDTTHEVRELQWRIKQLSKQCGRQGETIHRLRCELAEALELTTKAERGEMRTMESVRIAMLATIKKQGDTIAELREKLAAATEMNKK